MMLITGASSGIGLELARVAAEKGHDLVLVARTEEKLRELAGELHERHGVRAEVIAADLSRPGAAGKTVSRIETLGIQIDALVNNAGFGVYGPFTETPLATELQMIQVNIVALTELTKRLLPGWWRGGAGGFSTSRRRRRSCQDPLMAVYYASKAYVLSFSEAIANELAGTGVTVTVLCPGPTASGFQAAAKLEESKLVAGKTLATARAGGRGRVRAMMAGKTVAVPGLSNKLVALVPRLLPRKVVRRAATGEVRGVRSGGPRS